MALFLVIPLLYRGHRYLVMQLVKGQKNHKKVTYVMWKIKDFQRTVGTFEATITMDGRFVQKSCNNYTFIFEYYVCKVCGDLMQKNK